MNISFSDINLNSTSSSFGIFMRSYAGIDAKGHFGLFAELEASYKTGKSVFSYKSNEEIKYTHSNNRQFKFSFNPAVRSSSSRTYAPPSPSGSAACSTRK